MNKEGRVTRMTVADKKRSTLKRSPTKAQVFAAKMIVRRKEEGKGNLEVTPRIRELAAMSIDDVPFDA